MSKFLGFLLGVAVALAGPAVFGVLAAPGGIELNAKGMALAFGIGALIFWAVVSYFSGAGALGAFAAFGTLVYCWLWIPNRTTNFLNDVPGITNGMIEGSKQYTLNGVAPILGVISLVYAIQLIVRSVQRRRRERAEAERLQREQEAAQAQQQADVAAVYPVAGSTYQAPAAYESQTRYDDLFDEPEPVQPRNQADEQTRQIPVAAEEFDQTRPLPQADAKSNDPEETAVAPAAGYDEPAQQTEAPAADETPAPEPETPQTSDAHQQPSAQPVAAGTPAAADAPAAAGASAAATQPAGSTPQAAAQPEPAEDQPQTVPAEDQTQTVPAEGQAQAGSSEVKVAPAEGEAGPDEGKKAEQVAAPQQKEQVGSQYRERMEDPEDTGEFHLAFENPVVRPA